MLPKRTQVIIVGAGPVGLLTANLLERLGLDFVLVERERAASAHSRSIGVHPTSLELLDRVGLARPLVENGVAVQAVKAFRDGALVGTLDFTALAPPFNFVLSIPQGRTERIFERELRARRPDALARGVELVDLVRDPGGVRLSLRSARGEHVLRARYVVGCDGKQSLVRRLARIPVDGRPYRDTYLMGDFEETTDLGPNSAVYLQQAGPVESFPLPDRRRRWVVRTERLERRRVPARLARLVRARIGHRIDGAASFMISAYGIQRLLARSMAVDGILLAGDAAHVISPSTGQGMNLGFLDARRLAGALRRVLLEGRPAEPELARYSEEGRRAARRAMLRAELYMLLCRSDFAAARDLLVRVMLGTPLHDLVARVFTMRGLERPGALADRPLEDEVTAGRSCRAPSSTWRGSWGTATRRAPR